MACNSSKELLFNIVYDQNVTTLPIPKLETVGGLKAKIAKVFGVEPKNQKLENWYKEPHTDSSVLVHLICPESEIHYLNLSVVEEVKDSLLNKQEEKSLTETELEVCSHLIGYLEDNYNYTGFRHCSLKDALDQSCFAPEQNKKILLLYFHNKCSDFSNRFCSALKNPEIQEVIARRFFLLGWDVENSEFHCHLMRVLNKFTELLDLVSLLKTKVSTVFLIMPINESISVFTCIQGNVDERNILTALVKAEESLLQEIQFECELQEIPKQESLQEDFSSLKFQQLMCDFLGDRDYDSFEPDQNDLLKSKIGYAFFGPLKTNYDSKQTRIINKINHVILKETNKLSKWKNRVVISFIFNCAEPLPKEKISKSKKYSDYNPNTDLTPTPIFVLRKCKKSSHHCRIFVDNLGYVYQTWSEYISRNILPECQMVLPLNGRYQTDENGKVLLEVHLSPSCGLNLKKLQSITSTTGLVSGGILMAAAIPAITVAPIALVAAGITGIGIGMYSIRRRLSRRNTEESFANCKQRKTYFSLMEDLLRISGIGTDLSTANLVQLKASLLFFRNAVYNYTTSRYIIIAKIFNKPVRQPRYKEVVEVIRNVNNKSEVFEVLTKSNKLFMDNGVTFTICNSDVFLNGLKIEVNFWKVPHTNFLEKMQIEETQLNLSEIPNVMNCFRTVCDNNTVILMHMVNYTLELFLNIKRDIRNVIIRIFVVFVTKLTDNTNFFEKLNEMFPNHCKFVKLIDMIIDWLDGLVSDMENDYQNCMQTNDRIKKQSIFATFPVNITERLVEIFRFITKSYLINQELTESGTRELFHYFYIWLAKQIYFHYEKAARKEKRNKSKKKTESICKVCMGINFN